MNLDDEDVASVSSAFTVTTTTAFFTNSDTTTTTDTDTSGVASSSAMDTKETSPGLVGAVSRLTVKPLRFGGVYFMGAIKKKVSNGEDDRHRGHQ